MAEAQRDSTVWDYRVFTQGTGDTEALELRLKALGSLGWELCGFGHADRALGLNSLYAVLKRPIDGYPLPAGSEAAWYVDPSGRHERRYFDGRQWSEHVVDGEKQATDFPNVR